jgi:D-proline reductase (dithiol) PrdB
VSLVARHLEANGIPTLIIGSAIDIVEYCGVSRYLHADFPLGNPCGRPYDKVMQLGIISQAMALFKNAAAANTTERLDYAWSEDNSWRDNYSRVDASNRERLRLRGERRRLQQGVDRTSGKSRAAMIAEG